MAIDPYHVGLDHRRVHSFPHVSQEHRNPVHDLDGDVVHLVDNLDHTVRVDVIIEVADLHIAGRQEDALQVHRAHNLVSGNATSQHALRIQEDRDLPNSSTKCGRECYARHFAQLRPDVEVGQIAHFLLRHRLTAGRLHGNRKARRSELDDDRREDPLRQIAQVGIGEARDLGQSRVDVIR